MVLVGLGIALATISYLIYRVNPATWRKTLDYSSIVRARDHQDRSTTQETGAKENPSGLDHRSDAERSRKPSPSQNNGDEPTKSPESEITPKAKPRRDSGTQTVPQFTLDETQVTRPINPSKNLPQPDLIKTRKAAPTPINPSAPLPAPDSLTLQSAPLPDNNRLKSTTPSSSTLMPPPSVRPSALRPLPKLNSSSLNPPPSAASSLRGPPTRTLNLPQAPQTAGLAPAPSTSTLPPRSRPSRKVLLDPGHSPLDWANLTRNPPTPTFLRGDTVPQKFIKVTPSQVRAQNGRKGKDAWGTYQGRVYNLSPYAKFHPGGVGELMRGAGKVGEAEKLFGEIHPWVNWEGLLGGCLVGILVGEGDPGAIGGGKGREEETDLEAMD